MEGLQWAGVTTRIKHLIDTAKAVKRLSPFDRGNKEVFNGWVRVTKQQRVTMAYGDWEVVEVEDDSDTDDILGVGHEGEEDEFVNIEKDEVTGNIR
jgi:hypothetical protein